MSDPIVGIDLGTSNAVIAHASAAGAVTVLTDDAGNAIHPSVVSFQPGGAIVGAAAKQRKIIDPRNTIHSVRGLIGRSYHAPEVQTARVRLPFQITEGPGSAPMIVTRGGTFAVPEISAMVLDHLRTIASARLERPVERAVLTVPASFDDAQRAASAAAAERAGLTVVRVLDEPTAAALAYGHRRGVRQIIAVYDFGGGAFDVTLLRLEDQVYEVLGTSGDTCLGGDDLDERLVEKMAARFLADHRVDLRNHEVAMMRLRAIAEQTKIELSRRTRVAVEIDEIAYGPGGAPIDLRIEIARDELEREIADLVDRTFLACSEALARAGLSADRVADLILVGGTTKIPYVREQVGKFFGKAPRTDVDPEDAVAAGAALQATSLERVLARRTPSRSGVPPRRAVPDPAPGATGPLAIAADPAPGGAIAPRELTRADSERARRPTADPRGGDLHLASAPTRPDTRYSVTRAGVRDEVDHTEHHGTASRGEPLPPPAAPTGPGGQTASDGPKPAIHPTRPVGRVAVAPAQGKTASEVLPVPPEIGLGGAASLTGAPRRERPITATGTASPPPLPPFARRQPAARSPLRPATAPGPEIHTTPGPSAAAPSSSSGDPGPPKPPGQPTAATRPEAWDAIHSAATLPIGPATPIAPPTAPAPAAATPDPAGDQAAHGSGATAIATEPAPAATAGGFDPPRVPRAAPVHVPPSPGPPSPAHPPAPAQPPAPAPVLLEVTPRGLGIATVAGFCEELIRRNVRVPAEARKLFTTARDHQDTVRIVVCQGESRRLDRNTVIGDLVLHDLPSRLRGETVIEVTFALDASGVLYVRARDTQTGAEQRATLTLVGDIVKDDVAGARGRLPRSRTGDVSS